MTNDNQVPALHAEGLGMLFGRTWALRDCAFTLPRGRVAALVGPNGAGKTTLLGVAAGLSTPSTGRLTVFGEPGRARIHPRAAFVSQRLPLYEQFTVREMLRMAEATNERWSDEQARRVLDAGRISLTAKARTLSGGERTQLCLALALGREPDLLLLDEPLAGLDPLAREDVLRLLMGEVAKREMTILMSSHLISDLHEICDYLLLLDGGQVRLAGDVEDLLTEHRVLIGPAESPVPAGEVVLASRTARQATLLVRGGEQSASDWDVDQLTLQSLVVGYLRASQQRRRGELPDLVLPTP